MNNEAHRGPAAPVEAEEYLRILRELRECVAAVDRRAHRLKRDEAHALAQAAPAFPYDAPA